MFYSITDYGKTVSKIATSSRDLECIKALRNKHVFQEEHILLFVGSVLVRTAALQCFKGTKMDTTRI